ncbi:hypothetical protein D3C87_2073750 [compost metagenome]
MLHTGKFVEPSHAVTSCRFGNEVNLVSLPYFYRRIGFSSHIYPFPRTFQQNLSPGSIYRNNLRYSCIPAFG